MFSLNVFEQFEVIEAIVFCRYSGITNVEIFLLVAAGLFLNFFFSNALFHYFALNIKFITSMLIGFYEILKEKLEAFNKVFYFYLITFSFMIVLACNLVGLSPYALTVTAYLIVTFFLSSVFFLCINLLAVKIHGLEALKLFLPPGTPEVLIPFLIIIEIISYFARVASLSIRLFANMTAGHALLKILTGFLWISLGSFLFLRSFAVLFVLLILVVFVLEVAVAFLQAVVYVILINIYAYDTLRVYLH